MNKTEDYEGFEISWQEPPQTSAKWTGNVGSTDLRLFNRMGGRIEIIDGQTRDEMIANAKAFIDGLGT